MDLNLADAPRVKVPFQATGDVQPDEGLCAFWLGSWWEIRQGPFCAGHFLAPKSLQQLFVLHNRVVECVEEPANVLKAEPTRWLGQWPVLLLVFM